MKVRVYKEICSRYWIHKGTSAYLIGINNKIITVLRQNPYNNQKIDNNLTIVRLNSSISKLNRSKEFYSRYIRYLSYNNVCNKLGNYHISPLPDPPTRIYNYNGKILD